MKIRTDFVSNSSSSSFIITTKESQKDLFDFIVLNAHNDRNDEYDYWRSSYDKLNREFLEDNFNKYVQLVIGDFYIFGSQYTTCIEDSEDSVKNRKSLEHIITKNENVSKFVKDGKVLIDYNDLFIEGKCPEYRYPSFKAFEITQDSIDFTRWLITKCANKSNNSDYRALKDFCDKEITEDMRNGKIDIPICVKEKWKELSNKCNGLLICPTATRYVKNESDKYSHPESYPLTDLLDEYEKRLKDGNRIYRLCVGYSGEGTDWSSYIWTSNSSFNKNDKIKFEYDMWW